MLRGHIPRGHSRAVGGGRRPLQPRLTPSNGPRLPPLATLRAGPSGDYGPTISRNGRHRATAPPDIEPQHRPTSGHGTAAPGDDAISASGSHRKGSLYNISTSSCVRGDWRDGKDAGHVYRVRACRNRVSEMRVGILIGMFTFICCTYLPLFHDSAGNYTEISGNMMTYVDK